MNTGNVKLAGAIEVLTKEKIILMIAYRLKTVRNVNQILVVIKEGLFRMEPVGNR